MKFFNEVIKMQIFLTHFKEPIDAGQYWNYLQLLPDAQQKVNRRFVRWQDQHAHLIGKLLLVKALNQYGYSKTILDQLHYTANRRPYLPGNVDFNISHSGPYVICAIGENVKLGIDVEEIKPIDFGDFRNVMTRNQWIYINQAAGDQRFERFYDFWTLKESVIKADGRGLTIPLQQLEVQGGRVQYDDAVWHVKSLDVFPGASVSLASNLDDLNPTLVSVDIYQPMELL